MEEKMKALFKNVRSKPFFSLLFLVILAFGIFLRIYHFSSWLHFEVDQTWDYDIVSNAITNGISHLPLLGPTAGGGRALRLGPAFYYMEYLSALVFGNNPTGHAMLVLLSSIFAIPLFYLFAKRYFSPILSLGLMAVFSFSFYLVMYGRFSWSPNVLPLLILLSFYTLLRSVSKEEKHPARWFLVMVTAASITTQIHFNAFFTIPAIIFVFLAIKRPHFPLKVWAAAIGIVFLIYSPMILNEIKSHGEDTRFFLNRVGDPGRHALSFTEKTSINVQYNAYEYFLAISGNDQINYREPARDSGLGLSCKKDCVTGSRVPIRILAMIYFFLGLGLLIANTIKEKLSRRKDFLILTLLWFVFSFLYFFKIYDSNILFPRFFLLVSPLSIIFLGLILQPSRPEKNKFSLIGMLAVIAVLGYSNISPILSYFNQLKNVSTVAEEVKLKDVFPFSERATFDLQQQVAKYIAAKESANGFPVYVQCDHEYASVYWYLLNQLGIQQSDTMLGPDIPADGNYFLVARTTLSKVPLEEIHIQGFSITDTKQFGSITVYTLAPQAGAHLPETLENSLQYVSTQKSQISEMLTWRKLFEPYKAEDNITLPASENSTPNPSATDDDQESLGQ